MGNQGQPTLLELIAHPELYIQNYPYHTYYRGEVVDVNDPEKRGRVKVRVESIWKSDEKNQFDQMDKVPVEDIPWAEVLIHGQNDKSGLVFVPKLGTYVICAFEKGHSDYPIVLGGWFARKELPLAARGGSEGATDTAGNLKGMDTADTADGGTITEPANPYAAVYPQNVVYRSTSGHLIEVDDTSGAERINIAHKSGSWAEFHPDGTLVFGIQGKRYTVIEGDDGEHIKGNQDVVVGGNATHNVDGNYSQDVGGNSEVVILNTATIEAATIVIESNSTLDLKANGVVNIGPGTALGDIVTIVTHPVDYITGIPILGTPFVKAG